MKASCNPMLVFSRRGIQTVELQYHRQEIVQLLFRELYVVATKAAAATILLLPLPLLLLLLLPLPTTTDDHGLLSEGFLRTA